MGIRTISTVGALVMGWTAALGLNFDSYKLDLSLGIISTDIRAMAQDDLGYIWLGSTYGLVRYDGLFFHTYLSSAAGNTYLLPDNHIRELINWKDGLMVVRTQGSMCVLFDTRRNQFVPFPLSIDECRRYSRIWLDQNKRLWLFDNKGRGVSLTCDGSTFKRRRYTKDNSVPADIRENKSDNKGNRYELIGNECLKYHDKDSHRDYVFKIFDQSPFTTPYVVRYNVLAVGDNIWVSTYGSGITVYNKATGEVTHIRKGYGGTLQTNFIISIMADRQDNVWVLQDMHGVVCISTGKKQPTPINLSTNPTDEQANMVKAVCRGENGTLLVGTNAGQVVNLDTAMNIVKRTPLDDDAPLSMLRLSTGETAIGTRSHGVRIGGEWHRHDDRDRHSPSANKVIDMAEDKEGRVWMATQGGNLDAAMRKGSEMIFRHLLPQGNYRSVAIDHRGNVWAGSETTLYMFNPREILHSPSSYVTYNVSGTKSGVNDINHIIEDKEHRIWVATLGKGVFWTDNSGDRPGPFHRLCSDNGLVNDMVAAIGQDRFGHIWMATQKGMTIYDPKTKNKRNIFANSSTGSNIYTDRSVCQLPDGRLVFGTITGLVVYSPQANIFKLGNDDSNQAKSALALTDVLVSGVSIIERGGEDFLRELREKGQISLPHGDNSPTFRFSNFNYDALYKTHYQYKLEGFDDEWSPLTTMASATYTELPTGNYTFKVRAFRSDSDTAEEYSVRIAVLPPWWLTWWALLAYLLTAAAVVTVTYRQLKTVYSLRQSIRQEKQMTDFKLRFFTDISHEFRTPLTIIHGAVERLMQSKNLPGHLKQPVWGIAANEERMMRLINQLLEFRKMENGKLRLALQETDVVAFLRNIFNGFVETAEQKHINFVFSMQQKTLNAFIDRGHVDKIAYNLIGNALKYTPDGGDVTVRIAAQNDSNTFAISVEDNGVGVPSDKREKLFQRYAQSSFTGNSMGIGLNLTKELVRVHHGEIAYSENSPKGSVFTVTLPLRSDVYQKDDFLATDTPLSSGEQTSNDVVGIKEEYREMEASPYNDRHVLVVEDDSSVLEFLRSLLSRFFTVTACASGEAALAVMEEKGSEVALVVTDVMMPGLDGYGLVGRLKARQEWTTVPVVMLTAVSGAKDKEKALGIGVDAFLTKPFENNVFIATCCNLIEKYDMLKRSFTRAETKSPAVPRVIKDEKDKQFVDVLDMWIDAHLDDTHLSVDRMAEAMQFGRTVFYDKVKSLKGMSPNEYLKKRRMETAADLLAGGHANISEVAYKVGFADPHYFSQAFKKYYGITPKKYQRGV